MAVEEEESFSAVAMECVAVKNRRSSVVVATPGAIQGGGNGDGWTTGKHRNADAVRVSRKRERRHRFISAARQSAVVDGDSFLTLREVPPTVVTTRHRRGADPARGATSVVASRA
jgi:hypothetical protein